MALYELSEIHELVKASGLTETPFEIMDKSRLIDKATRFKNAFNKAQVVFAVKSNSHPDVLTVFNENGLYFDVASYGEVETLVNLGVDPSHLLFSAPTKIPSHIKQAYEVGVRYFAFDTLIELDKLAELAPGSNVVGRVTVDNHGSFWPLEKKFGITTGQEVQMFQYALQSGLRPFGLTFHVGSQNTDPEAWVRGLNKVSVIWSKLNNLGIHLDVINCGGGFPARFEADIPMVEEIAPGVNAAFAELFDDDVKLYVEPGRGLVGDSGIMVTTVINRTSRYGKNWLYLDVGAFNGLIEGCSMYNFEYPVMADRNDTELMQFTLAGPTCDSADIFHTNAMLPGDITYGERVYILTAGAYTNSMIKYNGLDFPPVAVVGTK